MYAEIAEDVLDNYGDTKIGAFILGGLFITVQFLGYNGYVKVNYEKIHLTCDKDNCSGYIISDFIF